MPLWVVGVNRLLYWLTARLPCRLISLDSGPYLERYYLGEWFGVTCYLHRFVSGDSERHMHNHPWAHGRALVLSGSYVEEVAVDLYGGGCLTERHTVRWWNVVNGNTFHRIHEAKPGTWTLFMHGERQRIKLGMTSRLKGWGFIEDGQFMP